MAFEMLIPSEGLAAIGAEDHVGGVLALQRARRAMEVMMTEGTAGSRGQTGYRGDRQVK